MDGLWCLTIISVSILVQGKIPTPTEDLSELFKDFQSWRISQFPYYASMMDIQKYNDRLTSYNFTRFEKMKVKADTFRGRLLNISMTSLESEEKKSYRVLKYMLDTFIDGYKWRYYQGLNPVNFLEDITLSAYAKVPMDTRGDVENYVFRLEQIPRQFSEIKESFQEAINRNVTYHNVSMTRLIPRLEKMSKNEGPKNSSLFYPLDKSVEVNTIGFTQDERNNLLSRATAAITAVYESLRDLTTFFKDVYMPATRTQYGVRSFPNGAEYYRSLVRWYLTIDMTPEEVHDIGQKEVARISALMKGIMAKQGHNGTVAEYFESLTNVSKFFYKTGDELINGYIQQIEEIKGHLPKFFKNLPGLPLIVLPTPTDGIVGYYSSGTADGKTPGKFYTNTFLVNETVKFGMMALTMHEGNPGHHLQISYVLKSKLPDFRSKMISDYFWASPYSFGYFNAYVEGWALYAESLGEEMKLYKDDYELIGRYSSEIFRACRLVVDTGLHYFNWTRDQSIQFFKDNVIGSKSEIVTEIDRYITWPGQALAYKIGELKIIELRKKAEDKLGKNFDIREFHAAILENGDMPLSLLEEVVNDWMDNYTPVRPTQGPDLCTSGSPDGMLFSVPLLLLAMISIKILR